MVYRVLISKPERSAIQSVKESFPNTLDSSCAEIDALADQIEAFLCGEDIRFSLDMARFELCPEFQQCVLRAEHHIPRGSVSTYKRIALHLDRPNGARAVGSALAKNPFPIIIPCHRAVRSDRMLGGYQGGLAMKRALLELEGIFSDNFGRISTENFFY
jgi:methylated-DNA-[protein]-cysteine S-methyltransferase